MQTPPPNQCAVSGPLYKRAFNFNGEGLDDIKSFLELYDVPVESYGQNMRDLSAFPMQRDSGSEQDVLDLKLMETAPSQKVAEAVSPAASQTHESLIEQGQCSNPFCPCCLSSHNVSSQSGERQTAEHHHQNSLNSSPTEMLSSPFNNLGMTSTPSPQARGAREEFDERRMSPGMSPGMSRPYPSAVAPSQQPMMWNPSGMSATPFQPQNGLHEFTDPDDLSIQGLLNDFMSFNDGGYQDGSGRDSSARSSPSYSVDRISSSSPGMAPGDGKGSTMCDSMFTVSSPQAHVSSVDPGIGSSSGGSVNGDFSPSANQDVKPFHLPPTYEPGSGEPPVRDKTEDEQDHPIRLGCGIVVTERQVVDMPVHELNRLLYQSKLTEAEISLVKETRRRGKNKVAARNCRKRKLDTISELEKEVEELKGKKSKLAEQKASIENELQTYKEKTEALTRFILERVKDDSGLRLNSDEFTLEKSEDGRLFVLHKLRTANGKTVAVVA